MTVLKFLQKKERIVCKNILSEQKTAIESLDPIAVFLLIFLFLSKICAEALDLSLKSYLK